MECIIIWLKKKHRQTNYLQQEPFGQKGEWKENVAPQSWPIFGPNCHIETVGSQLSYH